MAKSKNTRTRAHGSSEAGRHKSAHRTTRGSTGKSRQGETAPRRVPSEVNREPTFGSQYGGRSSPQTRPEELVDEETAAQSRRPGGTGDASLGDDNEGEGPEGPAR